MSKLQLSVPKVLIEPDAKCWLHGLFDMPRVERMRDYTPHVIASNRDRMGSRAPRSTGPFEGGAPVARARRPAISLGGDFETQFHFHLKSL